jgi:Flp pilus assembly protein TadD
MGKSHLKAIGAGSACCSDFGVGISLFFTTLVAYLPTFWGDFIWNDSDYVTKPALRSLAGLSQIWTKLGATEQYYPLLHSAFWVQNQLWGDHPLGYHIVAFLLHAGAAFLFALILRRLEIAGAWLAALIFALHPVHVESVAWISEQKNTLSIIFYLTAALWYLHYDETRRPRTYYAALGMFVLSLLCKTVTASLPAALLVVFWWKRGQLEWRRDFRPLVPWLAIGAGMGMFTSWVEQNYLGAKGEDFTLPFWDRLLVAGRAIWFYLGNFVWPTDLNFIYPRWTPDASVWWQWLFPLSACALAGGLWVFRHRSRAPLAAYLFFTGSLFPVLGFVNLYGARYSFVWDHWQYLPDLGLIALTAAGLVHGWNCFAIRIQWVGPALAAVLATLLGAMTWEHSYIFRDNQTLYRDTIARNPNAWMAHFNLGVILADIPGRLPDAIEEYEETLRIKPDHWKAHANLGNALLNIPNRLSDAIAQYEAALQINPQLAEPHFDLGNALMRVSGHLSDATAQYEEAVRIKPDFTEAHFNLANILTQIPGRLPDAIAHYRAALKANPDMAEAHFNLGIALLNYPQQLTEAMAQLNAARRIRPDLPPATDIVQRWRTAQ